MNDQHVFLPGGAFDGWWCMGAEQSFSSYLWVCEKPVGRFQSSNRACPRRERRARALAARQRAYQPARNLGRHRRQRRDRSEHQLTGRARSEPTAEGASRRGEDAATRGASHRNRSTSFID